MHVTIKKSLGGMAPPLFVNFGLTVASKLAAGIDALKKIAEMHSGSKTPSITT